MFDDLWTNIYIYGVSGQSPWLFSLKKFNKRVKNKYLFDEQVKPTKENLDRVLFFYIIFQISKVKLCCIVVVP